MKKIYYKTNETCMCLDDCPYEMRHKFTGNVIKIGTMSCVKGCKSIGKHSDDHKYIYCNHPETNNRNGANK